MHCILLQGVFYLVDAPRGLSCGYARRTTRSDPMLSHVSLSIDLRVYCRSHFQQQAGQFLPPHLMNWVAYMRGFGLTETRWPSPPYKCEAQRHLSTLHYSNPSTIVTTGVPAMNAPVSTEIPLQTFALDLTHRHAEGEQTTGGPLHAIIKQQGVTARRKQPHRVERCDEY